MNVFNVNIISHNSDENSYKVQYCIGDSLNVVRRTTAVFKDNSLSRDNDKDILITKIKNKIPSFKQSSD